MRLLLPVFSLWHEESGLASRILAGYLLNRHRGRQDIDALMAAHAQQMPIPGDDDVGGAGHCRGDDVIVIDITGHDARC